MMVMRDDGEAAMMAEGLGTENPRELFDSVQKVSVPELSHSLKRPASE